MRTKMSRKSPFTPSPSHFRKNVSNIQLNIQTISSCYENAELCYIRQCSGNFIYELPIVITAGIIISADLGFADERK